jgi:presenilin-like A22 family membrane protease
MKHNLKVTALLIAMFFIAQIIGIFVAYAYLPQDLIIINPETGEEELVEQYNLPYGLDPPPEIQPQEAAYSIVIALFIAVILMFTLMKLKAEVFLRIWFLIVVILGIAIALNAFLIGIQNSAIIALAIAIPLGAIKIFQRNLIVHNLTELLIYPGIAIVFIPLFNVFWAIIILVIISIYDIYAVWHAGFMQKMAKYQIETLRIFSGFFVPYIGKKERQALKKLKSSKAKKIKGKEKKIGINVAILGGGDVVFPILLAGVVLGALGIFAASLVAIGSTIALGVLFYMSEKGKFYPAMPFISTGALLGLILAYLI